MKASIRHLADDMRVVPIIMGLGAMLVANRALAINVGPTEFGTFDALFSAWLWTAGFVSLAYAAWFSNRWLMAISGSLLCTGLLSRAVAVIFRLADSTQNLTNPQLHIAGIIYTLLALTTFIIWWRVMAPLLRLRQALED